VQGAAGNCQPARSGNFADETRITELAAELEDPATCEKPGRAVELNRALMGAQESLARLNPESESKATKLAAME
jgi:hypothetical protein